MVELARQARGLTQTGLARKIECGQPTISKIEQGDLIVSDEMLDRLCEILQYPRSFFFQPGEIHSPGLKYSRVRKSLPKRIRDAIDAKSNIKSVQLRKLLSAAEIIQNVPHCSVQDFGSPEEVAAAVREYWRIPRGPVRSVVGTIEDAGIIVAYLDFETDKWDGMHIPFPGLPPIMFLNERMPGDRIRFSATHELGHIVMHREPIPIDVMEDEANRFAAAFLMPDDDIEAHLQRVDLPRLASLKKTWGVSIQALLTRARSLDIINDRRYRYLYSKLSAAGWRRREPPELDIAKEAPTLISEILALHSDEFHMDIHDIRELVSLEEPEFRREFLRTTEKPRIYKLNP